MAATQLNTNQVLDGTVNRDDLNITTVGKSVVRRLIAGTNITFTQTGADTGTGDVTINASGGGGGVADGEKLEITVSNSGANYSMNKGLIRMVALGAIL
jgi:hypothetical protein